MLENSSIKNGDEQEEYIFKTLREKAAHWLKGRLGILENGR